MECVPEKTLYKEIMKRVEENQKEDLSLPEANRTFWSNSGRSVFEHLGFSTQVFYDIKNFLKDKQLGCGKKKPLHENRLKKLCEAVGIKYHGIYYMVNYEL